jgi:hypothetical protein
MTPTLLRANSTLMTELSLRSSGLLKYEAISRSKVGYLDGDRVVLSQSLLNDSSFLYRELLRDG